MAERAAEAAFGTLLREYRVTAGLTQELLAERARMSAVGIRALERGYRASPRFATVQLIAEALQLPPDARARLEAAARRTHLDVEKTSAVPHAEETGISTNLPLRVTSFRGRESEVERLSQLLIERPLVTLCGPGGIGKTSLAIETARTIAQTSPQHVPDGVWLIELAALGEDALVASQIAMVLDIDAQSQVPLLDTLVSALRRKRMLLILDNCEHLLQAAATVAQRLMTGCPRLRIVATSREPLRVAGERVERVSALNLPPTGDDSLPSIEELYASPAVRLFLDRAADRARAFDVLAEDPDVRRGLMTVAQRTEGIPLAIELAAARMGTLTLPALAQRLDDRFRTLTGGDRTALPRQQTLRATLDWSYGLLSEKEQLLFARLGIFAGGWTLDAAESVCSDARMTPDDVPELLSSLVDKSLVVPETVATEIEPRYRLLELMRAYALEQLAQRPGESERIARRHAEYYRTVAEQIDATFGTRPRERASLEADLDNFRAALSWTLDSEDGEDLGTAIAAPLHDLFNRLSLYDEGIGWCTRALTSLGTRRAPHQEADLQRNLAVFSWYLRGPKAAGVAALRASTLYRELGDGPKLSDALTIYAAALYFLGEREESDRVAGEALALAREQDEPHRTVLALSVKGLTTDPREVATRYALLDEALVLCQRHSRLPREFEAFALVFSGQVAFEVGDLERARESARRSVREAGTKGTSAFAWGRLAAYASVAGDVVEADLAAREALAVFPAINSSPSIAAVQTLSAVAALDGDFPRAARLLGAVDVQLAALQRPRDVVEEAVHQQVLALLRTGIHEDELTRLMAEGAASAPEQTIDEALALTPHRGG